MTAFRRVPRTSAKAGDERPLVVHVVYRFDVGGLENGLVNLLNRLPANRYRHAVIALTEVTSFRSRVTRDDVLFIALNKRPGHGIKLMPRLFRVFRQLQPSIVHTRNLAALEATVPAWVAGVGVRVHGEHGRDVSDLDGSSTRYRLVRKMHRPFVSHYVALSGDLERYLIDAIGVPPSHIARILNGVDTQTFRPAPAKASVPNFPFAHSSFVFGTVGRLQAVKNQVTLARAFVRMLAVAPHLRSRVRLLIVGEGPLRAEIEQVLAEAGASSLAWLPGPRDDVSEMLRLLDVFVLPSKAEGISNSILEAMATGLPIIASRVGGNAELVDESSGSIVAADDEQALAGAMLRYATDPLLVKAHGAGARMRAEHRFGVDAMVAQYASLYDRLLSHQPYPGDLVQAAGTARAHSRGR